jgi:hypothetical protein
MQLRITLQRRLTFFKKWISKSLKIKMMTDTNKIFFNLDELSGYKVAENYNDVLVGMWRCK